MAYTNEMKREKEVLEVALLQTNHAGDATLRQQCYPTAERLEGSGRLRIDWHTVEDTSHNDVARTITRMEILAPGREQLEVLRNRAWSSGHFGVPPVDAA
jgi:hypothetical protein